MLVKQWLYRDSLKPAAELDGAGVLQKQFVYVAGKTAPDLIIAGGVTYRVLSDQLGSPRLVVNTTDGSVAARMRHDAFGKVLEDTIPGFVPFGFAGGLYDADTGLVRFGARDYDSVTGRWTAKDPVRFDSPDGSNLYVYVRSDPVNSRDPNGESAVAAALPIAGGAAIADGPLPIGDIIGVGLLICAAIYDAATDEGPDCNGMYATDVATCNGISRRRGAAAARRCFASAAERYGNCLAGRPIGPLDTWNN